MAATTTSNWKIILPAAAAGAAFMALLFWGGSHLGSDSAPPPAPIAAAPAPEPVVPMQPACLPGYTFYPDKGACVKVYDKPVEAVKNAGCNPGDKREVPDPANPGHTLYQVCGYSSGG